MGVAGFGGKPVSRKVATLAPSPVRGSCAQRRPAKLHRLNTPSEWPHFNAYVWAPRIVNPPTVAFIPPLRQ
jgi:hypothetical protein